MSQDNALLKNSFRRLIQSPGDLRSALLACLEAFSSLSPRRWRSRPTVARWTSMRRWASSIDNRSGVTAPCRATRTPNHSPWGESLLPGGGPCLAGERQPDDRCRIIWLLTNREETRKCRAASRLLLPSFTNAMTRSRHSGLPLKFHPAAMRALAGRTLIKSGGNSQWQVILHRRLLPWRSAHTRPARRRV